MAPTLHCEGGLKCARKWAIASTALHDHSILYYKQFICLVCSRTRNSWIQFCRESLPLASPRRNGIACQQVFFCFKSIRSQRWELVRRRHLLTFQFLVWNTHRRSPTQLARNNQTETALTPRIYPRKS